MTLKKCCNQIKSRLNGKIKNQMLVLSSRRKIDVMCAIRGVFIEHIDILTNVRNKTGFLRTKKSSIKRYKKIMAIIHFMTKLHQNILLYFHCPDIIVDIDEN